MMNRKRKRLLVGTLITLVLIIGGVVAYQILKPREQQPSITTKSSSSSSSTTDSSSTEESSELSTNEKNYRQALASLEKSNEKTDDHKDDIISAINTAQEAMKNTENVSEVTGNFDNKMMFTPSAVAQTFGMFIKMSGYTVDTNQVEIFKSKNSYVLQFICVLTKEGENNSYWTGNFNIQALQLGFVRYYGGKVGATFG